MSKNNKVIVYIDENEDNMYYEELNKKGKMQISVYDEEFESWIEYHHDIEVKSLQEYNDKKTANIETKLKEERNETLKYEKIYEDKIADLEAKLAVADDCADRYWKQLGVLEEENKKLKEFIEKRENCNEWLTMKDNENLQYEITQLKQQLAEKDKAIENWQTMYQSVMQSCHNGIEEDKRLREQLAEKENRIIELSNGVREIEKIKDEKIKEIRDFHTQRYKDLLNRQNQDKISFCIEQLEKVKELIFSENNIYMDLNCLEKMEEIFDNQIEELKKEIK